MEMEAIEFWKMNGSGNDFILIDNREGRVEEKDMSLVSRRICRRRESVGADGVIFVTDSERFDFGWRFFNADGSEAGMCGNGGRCVSRFAFLKEIAGPGMTFETSAGPVSAEVKGRRVTLLMPKPSGLTMDLDLVLEEGRLSADFIHTGVPHAVVRVESPADFPVLRQGRAIRNHPRFAPTGTNVDFMRCAGTQLLEMRTYERGVEDETLACGTGAVACALTASIRGLTESPTRIRTMGGEELVIHFQRNGEVFEKVQLEGNTSIVYQGRLHVEAL